MKLFPKNENVSNNMKLSLFIETVFCLISLNINLLKTVIYGKQNLAPMLSFVIIDKKIKSEKKTSHRQR